MNQTHKIWQKKFFFARILDSLVDKNFSLKNADFVIFECIYFAKKKCQEIRL